MRRRSRLPSSAAPPASSSLPHLVKKHGSSGWRRAYTAPAETAFESIKLAKETRPPTVVHMNLAKQQEEEKLLTRLADAWHQNRAKTSSSQERPKKKRSLSPPESSHWANSTQPSQKDRSAEAARNEEPTSAEEGPRTPTQLSGPSLAAQNEELREKCWIPASHYLWHVHAELRPHLQAQPD